MRIGSAASRKRTSVGVVLTALLAASLLPLTSAGAQAGPNIEFLSPSGYTTNVNISDKADDDASVHLVAWVAAVPTNPLVEFEISSATSGASTIDAQRAGNDSWEASLQVSSLADGQYTLRATLFKDFTGPGTGTEVDTVTRVVTLNRSDIPPPPPSNTVEITYPENGSALGTHTPKGKRVTAVIDAVASTGTRQIRVLYTTTAPGNAPEWVACGFGRVAEDRSARARCTLEEGTTGAQVTAVAAVANETPPPAEPNAVADATGDAHRVIPYEQRADEIRLNPETIIGDPSNCVTFTATVLDQSNRPIAGTNVDVHVTGPDDQIRFGNIVDVTGDFQAPDKGHVSGSRPAIRCSDKTNQGTQGDHNIPGSDDPQHIESISGTTNSGGFTFTLYSTAVGGTQINVWFDGDDDDTQQPAEISGGARMGWGEAPPPATREIFLEPTSSTAETGTCKRVEMVGKISGNPMAGQNVDVHITGPDESVTFCVPPDGSTARSPDGGTHTGNADDATTRHLEGEMDSAGRFVFGVTTTSQGSTTLLVWADTLDDDTKGTDEASRSGDIAWTLSGDRTISIQSNKSTANKGSKARITGQIDGSSACESGQAVKLKAKRLNRGKFRTVSSTTTDSAGSYKFNVVVRFSKKYRAVAPAAGACEKASSRVITIRAN